MGTELDRSRERVSRGIGGRKMGAEVVGAGQDGRK